VLKPGGLLVFHHHWVPGRGWPADKLAEYAAASGSDLVSCDDYVKELQAVGFELKVAEDIPDLAASHLRGQHQRMAARVAEAQARGEKAEVQKWLDVTVAYINQGSNFGIKIHGIAPAGAQA